MTLTHVDMLLLGCYALLQAQFLSASYWHKRTKELKEENHAQSVEILRLRIELAEREGKESGAK